MAITKDSTIRDVYRNPLGRDLLDRLLRTAKRSPKLLLNPFVGQLRLSGLEKLLGRQLPGIADLIVELLASHDETAPAFPPSIQKIWWKEAVCYQIYPRSFQDSNGDGIGDLAGIKSRLPYLKELGVDVLWLSPIYDSPCDDMGYDIRNYQKILKEFGTMQQFNSLLSETHKNGMKLIMDLVVNHTSDEHAWFQKALKDPTSPEKDYYLWAKGQNGAEPNNWKSFFSGPAWNYYPENDEWALHLFSKKQMDLNWDNPALRAEVYKMINWWLDKGVDGFRMDVINFISKDNLGDGNHFVGKTLGVQGIEHYFYGPHLHEYLAEMRKESFGKHDVLTVGETPGLGLEACRLLTAEERGELDLCFNFDHLDNAGESRMTPYDYDLRELKGYFLRWQQDYGNNCWQSLFFDNHDNPRMVSKVNSDPAFSMVIGKLLAVLMFTLKGTPFIYQGQELGMTNASFSSIDEVRDIETINRYKELAQHHQNKDAMRYGIDEAFDRAIWGTRDHARTPMQWDASKNAGFTSGSPWLKVNTNYPVINAENQRENPDSVFHFYRSLIALRKKSDALVYGDFHPVFAREKDTFCYFRTGGGEKYYIEINLTGDDQKRPGPLTREHRLLAANYGGVARGLRPYEANVYSVGPGADA